MRAAWRNPRTVLVGVFVLGIALAEGAANDWVALALTTGYGTTATGQVRIVVRRSGRKVRVAYGTLESGAVRGPMLLAKGPSRRGAYRVAVTYRGDADHLPATRTVRFRIGGRG